MDELKKECAVCGKEYKENSGEAWVHDSGKTFCGNCYMNIMEMLCQRMEEEQQRRMDKMTK